MRSRRVRTSQASWDLLGASGGMGLLGLVAEARKVFHDQDERFNDSNRDAPVKTTCAIGPIPFSTTPPKVPTALWLWSGELARLG